MAGQNIGILGGSFDPVHLGHLAIATAALREADLEKVLLMPARVSPFKVGKTKTADVHRLAMVRLAAATDPKLAVSDREITDDRVSYTIDTLNYLEMEHPDVTYWFIVGTDSFLQLDTWCRGEELLRAQHFILAPRPGYRTEEWEEKMAFYRSRYGARILRIHNPELDISSTEIRKRASEGLSLKGLVPESVERYIIEQGLYRTEIIH
ncbi:nicotinate-nucleotide adenylyltransferase [uncultured Eubacterium sp.]|uniref:nicotinate-nucleotide adenylyltransferase n=1 Tax=uncultured Eubacterium sp. TaxID=165185 RepID=UPI0025957EA0|nr:nicotinate-nucleotide adenylyltransferase [uncultured Eubacterium sp.]